MHSRGIKISYLLRWFCNMRFCLSCQAAESACSFSPLCAVFRALQSTVLMHEIRDLSFPKWMAQIQDFRGFWSEVS